MKKLRVVMVGPLEINGGMSSVMMNYIDSFELNRNIELEYISTAKEGSKLLKINKLLKSIILFVRLLLFNKIDIVHIHTALDASIYRKGIFIKLGKLFNKKVILHFHASDLEDFYFNRCNYKRRDIVKKIFNSSDMVIALNCDMKKKLNKIIGVESRVLYNFTKEVDECSIQYDKNSKNILMISRLTKNKGVYDAINAMKYLNTYGMKLILAGTSEEIGNIKKYLQQQELRGCVKLVGWVDSLEKEKLFKNCFVSILPSYFEGIPMSILESMSFGVPVIASKVGGIPEIVSNNEGYLHTPGNVDDLIEKIEKIYLMEEKRLLMSKSCVNRHKTSFGETRHIEKLICMYKDVIDCDKKETEYAR